MPAQDNHVARPVLFLGLGSSGAKIVSKLKARIESEGDPWTNQFYRYVRITSEVRPEKGVDPNIQQIILSTQDLASRDVVGAFSESMNPDIKETFKKWWFDGPQKDENWSPWVPPVTSLDTGAGGVRPIGRMLLHYKSLDERADIVGTFQNIHQSIRDARLRLPPEKQEHVDENRVDCYVFGLLAGGTCSGMFLDVVYLLKTALPNTNVFGAFLLGDICYYNLSSFERDIYAEKAQRQNTLHSLAELMVLQSRTGREIVSQEWLRSVGRSRLQEAVFDRSPFHRITLVGARNQAEYYLRSFDEYMTFVAEYYAGLFATEVHAKQIGRTVDRAAAHDMQVEESAPGRASNFERIGLLSIEIPKEKILALAKYDIARELAATHFKNAEPERWKNAQDSFLNAISWGAIEQQFAPPSESLLEEDLGQPSSATEFKELWLDMKAAIDAHYGPWRGLESAQLNTVLGDFESGWQASLSQLLRDLLGQHPQSALTLGGLEAVVKSLTKLIEGKLTELDSAGIRLQNELYADEEGGLERSFNSELDDATSSYPGGLFKLIQHKFWPGNDDVHEALDRYRRALCSLATVKATRASLTPLLRDLQSISIARRLVAGFAAEPVLVEPQQIIENLFDPNSHRRGLRQELISNRDEISKVFVHPILEEIPEATASVGGEHGQRRVDAVRLQIINNWNDKRGISLFESFGKIVDTLRDRPNLSTADSAMRNESIQQAIESLSDGLAGTFQTEIEQSIGTAINDMSIWDALTDYVRRRKTDDPAGMLKDMFSAYRKKADLFCKLSPEGNRDQFEMRNAVYYMCNEDDAADCFKKLGIRNPDAFLSELMNHALGFAPVPMEGTRTSKQALQVYFSRQGDLPAFYDGWEVLRGLLQRDSGESQSGEKYWSDRRWRKWIEMWHDAPDKPYLPSVKR